MKARQAIKRNEGFTLIEVMVVIVLIGILLALVGPRVIDRIGQGKDLQARADIRSMETALKLYKVDNGVYPSTEQGLQALVEQSSMPPVPRKFREGGYIEKGRVPKDPWGNEYIYLCPGQRGDLDIVSYGPDGIPGGDGDAGDISNWDEP